MVLLVSVGRSGLVTVGILKGDVQDLGRPLDVPIAVQGQHALPQPQGCPKQ